jgi:hypothetical protein
LVELLAGGCLFESVIIQEAVLLEAMFDRINGVVYQVALINLELENALKITAPTVQITQ